MSTGDLWLVFWLAVLAFALIAYLFSQRREEERQRKIEKAARVEGRQDSERQWKREQAELEQPRKREQRESEQRQQQLAQMRSKKRASDASPSQTGGESSSESIRREVWLRDRGRCVTCGSRENLKLNHIGPPSKGGSTTADNLHLLCHTCSQSMES